MKKIFVILFLHSFLLTFGQITNAKIDTAYFQERYKKIRSDGPKVAMDSTRKKSILCSDEIKTILNNYKAEKGKTYKAIEDVYYKLQALILFSYVVNNQYDSVIKYYKVIEKNCKNPNTLGSTNNYRSYAELDRGDIVAALFYIEEAIKNFKLSGNKTSENLAFFSLIKIHLSTNNFTIAKELLDVFEKENDITKLTNSEKADYNVFKADVINELESSEEAILFLNKVDLDIFKDDFRRLFNYQIILTRLYLKTKRYKKAQLALINVKDNNANLEYISSYNTLSAETYLGLQDYDKTLYFLNKIKENLKENYLLNDHIIYNTVYYKYYKAQGDFKKALRFLEVADAKQDSLNSKAYKLKTAVQNYRIKKDSQLLLLEEKNKVKDALIIKNRNFYIYLTILVSLIIFLVMLYVKNKKTYELKLQNIKAQEITNLKNTYIENLSHEIRTPLTIIQGYVELIRNNVFNSANVLNYSERSLISTNAILKTLNDFLMILKLEKKQFYSKKSTKNIGKFLIETITAFESIATLKHIKLYYKTNFKDFKEHIDYDFSSLEKILNNLINNAIKYSSSSSAIFIKALFTEENLTITIKDEGIGIDQKELPKIFSRFYQSEENKVNGGFGIGLSLVKKLTESLNGAVSVTSKRNIGTTFIVKLPLEIKNVTTEVQKLEYTLINKILETDGVLEDVKTTACNKPKVLIVDDDALILLYIKELLKTDFNCTTVFNGVEAIELAKEIQFDLVISDLRMPVMQGFELKQKLNAMDNYIDIPFLIISASIYEEKSESIIKLGVDDFILKPFKANELLTRVYNLLENKILRNKLQKEEAAEKVQFFGHYAELMEKVNEIIQNNIGNQDFSVDELAKECFYSKRQLGRIIQAKTGLTPVKIILEVRLTKAYELLQKKEYQTVKEVVYAIGLSSVTYFNRVFFKRFGVKAKDLLN
ncbi:ATP-binding protein [Polaribacter sp. R77954]|uniref:hybrid sensor histidine kinase/response regulator transcription factor n=1 Tax=Polaribacter sp. R77954 TaxID=3093870 RepID=UPI0037C783B3